MALTLILAYSHQTIAQNVFPDRTPSQEYMQNTAPQGPLKANGGTGTGDGFDTGGGGDGTGNQNDTDAPLTDAMWVFYLMAVGYGIYRRKLTPKSPKGDLGE